MQTDVCIVGGGPAGLILGMLLAKIGVQVLVLEKNANFDREYRGEVLQPRFVQMMEQLGLRSFLESYPHLKMKKGKIVVHGHDLAAFDFQQILPEIPYALWMPQPILLQAFLEKAQELPSFRVLFHAQVKQLLRVGEKVVGVHAETAEGPLDIHAQVTVGADGRFSAIRRLGGFEYEYEHHENDIVWFTAKPPASFEKTFQILLAKQHGFLVLPKYPDSIQGGMTMKKGEWKQVQERGLEALREELLQASDGFRDFAQELKDFKPFTLLQAKMHLVKEWAQDGCLLVGDAAHCASPVGGIGVSLSTMTAILAADTIWHALEAGDVSQASLRRVQDLQAPYLRQVHAIQKRGESMMFATGFVKKVRPYIAKLATRTPLFRMVQRQLFISPKPLPIDPRLAFTEEGTR